MLERGMAMNDLYKYSTQELEDELAKRKEGIDTRLKDTAGVVYWTGTVEAIGRRIRKYSNEYVINGTAFDYGFPVTKDMADRGAFPNVGDKVRLMYKNGKIQYSRIVGIIERSDEGLTVPSSRLACIASHDPNRTITDVSSIIAARRNRKKIYITELAERVGVSKTTMKKYEVDPGMIVTDVIKRLCKELKLEIFITK